MADTTSTALTDTSTSIYTDELPEDRAGPFLDLYKRIVNEFIGKRGKALSNGKLGAGFLSDEFEDDYNANKNSDDNSPLIDSESIDWPSEDDSTLTSGFEYPWESKDQYYFELVSLHQKTSTHSEVGTGQRRWLDFNKIYDEVTASGTTVTSSTSSTPKKRITKKIEFLMHMLKMIYLANEEGIENVTSRHTWTAGANPKKGFLNIPMDEGNLGDHTCGFYFTSPDRDGSFDDDQVHAGAQMVAYSPSADVDGDLDGGSGHFNGSLSPTDKRAWPPQCDDEIRHLYRLNREPSSTTYDTGAGEYTFRNEGYRWESFSAQVTFEGFLYHLAQLINYLDVAFYTGAAGHRQAIEGGLRSVFKGGVRAIFFPAGSRESLEYPYLDAGGYSNLTFSDIDTMLQVVNSDRVLLPDWLREWWNAALTATSERTTDGLTPGLVGDDLTGTDFSADTAPSDPGQAFEQSIEQNAIDLESCDEPPLAAEDTPCTSCMPNPNAIVPNWTHPKAGPTFLNEKICEYSAIITTDLMLPPEDPTILEPFLEQGINLLLAAYKKTKVITVTYADGTEISADTIDILMGRVEASTYLGAQSVGLSLPYIKDKSVSTVPLVRMKVLAVISSELFDLLPVDLSGFKEEEAPVVSSYVQLKSKDVKMIIRQVSASFKVYAKRYAAYIHEMNYDETVPAESFGDLDFKKEADNLIYFREDLLLILKHHGFNYILAEKIKIGFKDDDGTDNWTPYQIEYMEVNEPGCAPILLDKITWQTIIEDSPWNNTRTLAYIAKLPDIWLDVTARVFPEWNVIATKYTYGLLNSEDLLSELPEDALECFVNDLLTDPLNAIMNDIAGDVLDFPDALANKFDKMLCAGDEFDRIDDPLEELKGLYKRAKDASLREQFTGDPVYEMLDEFFKQYKAGDDSKKLWSFVLDKYGYCGILALIDMILGCLLKGVATEDGLAIIIRAALKALDPLELEKMFIGLPPDKQAEIADAVAEAMGQITATPPWEKDYQPGNYSFGPERAGMLQSAIMKSKGKKLYESGVTLEDMSGVVDNELGAKDAANYAMYVGSLDAGEPGYMSQEELQSGLASNFPDEYGSKSLEPKNYSGVGTIGAAADDIMDAIFEAYTDAIFDLVDLDLLTESLQNLPGGAFIGSILSTIDCAIPPLFNPPLDDFMKTLELDFCRGNKSITLPKLKIPDIDWTNIYKTLMEAVLETIQNLIIKAVFMLIKFILDLMLSGLCKLLGLVGSALEAAMSDNFRDTFRNALCGDESNPTSQITDEQLDQSVAAMLAVLSGCPTPSEAAATALVTDMSAIMTDVQLIDLVNGEATDEVLLMIKEVVSYRHPEFACSLNSTSGISDLFGALGAIIPPEYKTLPRTEAMPILPAYCRDQSSVDEFYENQCVLLQQKGPLTEEICNEIINGIQDRAKQDIETLSNVVHNGLLDNLLPEVFADNPQCPGTWNAGIFPRNNEAVHAQTSVATEAIFDSIETLSQSDMNTGKGVVNMILAAKNGASFKAHMFYLTHFPFFTENKIPDRVAGHLEDIYSKDFSENIEFNTAESITTRTPPLWGADEEPSFMLLEKGNGSFRSKCYPSNTDFSDSFLEKYDLTDYGSTSVSFKTPDFTMVYEDYKDEQQYSFELEYSNYDIVNNRSVMNDYFRIMISHQAKLTDIDSAGLPIDALEWYEGFSGEQKTEEEITELVQLASEGYGTIDIDDKLDNKRSPKNSIYAELLRGSWDEPLSWIPEFAGLTSLTIGDGGDLFEHYYSYYDEVFEGLMKRVASMTANNQSFKHGMSTQYRGPEDEYSGGESIDFEAMRDSIESPTKVYLSGTYVDKENMTWQIPPEVYGGTTSYPAWYMQTPEYDGWMGIRQILSPDEIYTGCETEAKSLGDFSTLSDIVDDLYKRLPDDPRLTESEHCAMEHPWNKILDRYSSAGIEATIRATVRIYVLESLIRGMPSFVNVQGKFPQNFDDTLAAHVADMIEVGLMEQTRGRIFTDPLQYYLSFIEQIVQSFGKRIDLGDFEPTPAEQEAIDRLTGKSSNPNPLNQDYWERNDYTSIAREAWPGQVGAGIMSAVGSTLGPAGAIAGAIVGGGASVLSAKRRKKAIWKRYISHPDNLRDAKILLRRYIKDEMEYVCEKFNASYKPVVDNIHSLFLIDKRFILGAISAGGPIDVPDFDEATGPSALPTTGKLHEYIKLHGSSISPTNSTAPTLDSFWSDDSYYWPFVLEKYVKVSDKSEILTATDANYLDYGFTSPADFSSFKREAYNTGIMNFDTWKNWVIDNEAILSGKKIEDLFEKWEVGIRISHLALESDGYPSSSALSAEQSANLTNISQRSKAYKLFDPDFANSEPVKYLLPIVSVENPLDSTATIVDAANSLSSLFDAQFDCLVNDLMEHPRYKLLFEYCFSLPRIMSIFTIYNMKAFLPSIGSAESDDWETKLIGADQSKGGGKWGKKFRRWDWDDLFKKSKKQAKNVFEDYYNATDLGHQSDRKSEARQRRIDLNINLDLNFDWLGWAMKRKRDAPFDEMGRPCPLIEEED